MRIAAARKHRLYYGFQFVKGLEKKAVINVQANLKSHYVCKKQKIWDGVT
jgi:hypothetical protein